MIQKTKKRTMFFLGLFLAGLSGFMSNHVRTNYSKVSSLIIDTAVPTAYADGAWSGSAGSDGGCSGCDTDGGSDGGGSW